MTAAQRRARGYRAIVKARLRDTSVSQGARFIWLLIESYANTDGTNAFPSKPTLALLAGKDIRWVEARITELTKARWLSISGKRPVPGGRVNVYSLHHPENWGDQVTPKTWVMGHPIKGGKTGYHVPEAAATSNGDDLSLGDRASASTD